MISKGLYFSLRRTKPEPEPGMTFLGWIESPKSNFRIMPQKVSPLRDAANWHIEGWARHVALMKYHYPDATHMALYRQQDIPGLNALEFFACFRQMTPTELLTVAP